MCHSFTFLGRPGRVKYLASTQYVPLLAGIQAIRLHATCVHSAMLPPVLLQQWVFSSQLCMCWVTVSESYRQEHTFHVQVMDVVMREYGVVNRPKGKAKMKAEREALAAAAKREADVPLEW